MASSSPYTKPHFPYSELNSTFQARPTYQRKSCTYFFCKSLFFLMFLVVVPLFPSQAPDFVNQTLLSKFWELFHLMFIGIAVSYGLFSRKNVQVSVDETHSCFENQQSCLSKMFQVTSIFEDVEDPTASDEKKMNRVWYTQPHCDSMDDFGNLKSQSCGQKKPHYFIPKKRYENSYEFAYTDVGQACKSGYTQSGSVAVVAEANYSSGEWGAPGSVVNYKPLGLPIRSLRSNLTKTEDVEFDRGSESGSGSKNSSKSSENCIRSEFGDDCCVNLEKFDESVVTSVSPLQWRAKTGKKVMGEKVGNAVHLCHSRPLSIDETQFESLKKSRSLHSTVSHSSQTSSSSSSSMRKHRKMSSLSNISSKSVHSRQYSVSSLSEDSRCCSEDHLTERENPSECNESVTSFPHADRNFASIPKVASRGKSVRTIRANAIGTQEVKVQAMYRNQHDNNVGKKSEEAGASYMRVDGLEFGQPYIVNNSNQNPGNSTRLAKMTFSEIDKQKKEDSEVLLADAEDNSDSEGENIHASSDEEAALSTAGDAESGAHEVDKKAGEFIAKFRQQIKLQKMASIERSRWGSFSSTSSYFG